MKISLAVVIGMIALMSAAVAGSAAVVIERARAALGSEAALTGLSSIRYEGRILNPEGVEEGVIRLYFRRPFDQRIEVESDGIMDLTVVNDLEGFVMKRDLASGAWQRMVLPAEDVRRLHSNSVENLNFFRGPARLGGRTEYGGKVEKHGKMTDRVLFIYPNGVSFERFFDASGNLVATIVGEGGLELREKGKLESGGIQFPRRVETYSDGDLIRVVEFDRIDVNTPLNSDLFAFPAGYQ